ncbi:MAG: HD domain-containing protein [Myxococcales bacterium]|nr:HD domain-containing protein [Myxococcales bacterium]
MHDTPLGRAIGFLREADKLKSVLRRSRLSFDPERRENDAEHSWHLALMAIVLFDRLAPPGLDRARVLGMIVVHDLVEIDAGDTFVYDHAHAASQVEREELAADRIFALLPEAEAADLRGLWDEFEARVTTEARFARALDRVQPILQNIFTEGASWRAHGVTAAQVHAVNGPLVRDGAPELWAHVEALIDDAVARGWLPLR